MVLSGCARNDTEQLTMPKVDEYLTVKEAAEYFGISPNPLRN